MKTFSSMLLGALLALGASWLVSAAAPNTPDKMPGGVTKGGVVFGLNLQAGATKGMKNLTENTPVTLMEIDGGWILVDFPGQSTGPVWINSAAVISYRTNR